MKKRYRLSLVIFRRDLRIDDNTAFIEASSVSDEILPLFIFDDRQIGEDNSYKSNNAIQFMINTLLELDTSLQSKGGRLYYDSGPKAEERVAYILSQLPIEAVFVNRDYTPFSIKRDKEIEKQCLLHNVAFISCNDLLLINPESILTNNGSVYSKFTPFLKKARLSPILKPRICSPALVYNKTLDFLTGQTVIHELQRFQNKNVPVSGGRNEALLILKKLSLYNGYKQQRDIPAFDTTHLSAHHKFGSISIRETYWELCSQLGSGHPLIDQLYWRDFFTYIAYYSPFVFGQSFQNKFRKLPWNNDQGLFTAWSKGNTGVPIVDAGMRELNMTGFMHNRVRMIVASFLTKDLHIDWLWGEKYFATKLVDYDPAVNNGNWQWAASTGCDAQPYFRIFNPWLQQKKFDPNCIYIKRWVHELKDVPPKTIHKLFAAKESINGYPSPIVDHATEQKIARELYKKSE
jgi:deoxyribodipyrimidine photo-lyase